MGILKVLSLVIFLWVNSILDTQAQPYGYSLYQQTYNQQPNTYTSYAPPVDACPNIDVTVGLAGEALFKAVVQAHGQSSLGVALTAKANMGAYNYGPSSPSLGALKAFGRSGGIYLGYAYGLVDNSSPQTCLTNARAIVAIQNFFVSQRNNVIQGPAYGEALTGEAALQCQIKRKGQALYVVEQIGAANLYNTYPGPYLNLLISIVQNIQRTQRIVATNDADYQCNQVSLVLGQIFRDFLRVDYSDAQILDAYGLTDAQQYKAFYY